MSAVPLGVLASIAEEIATITETAVDAITVALADVVTDVNVSSIPDITNASALSCSAYGNFSSTTIQGALQELADEFFRGSSTPSGSNISEGDLWYNTNTEELMCYVEVSSGSYEWHTLLSSAEEMPTFDAGTYS